MSEIAPSQRRAPLSLQRLTAAFAQMLGGGDAPLDAPDDVGREGCEISPKAIVEGVLFVAADGGRPRTAEELASVMRDVSPGEVRAAVEQLNREYDRDAAPYSIQSRAEGYRLQLREELQRVRNRFYGREKEARLSPRALEVLAVVAYRQPTSSAAIDELRGGPTGVLLSQLVRKGLVRREAGGATAADARYFTTDRFLRLFRLDSLEQLPRPAELDD